MQPQTALERLWKILMAHFFGSIYCLFHWDCQMYIETKWERRPGYIYTEHTRFIGVVNSRQQIVRMYYGVPILRLRII